MSSGMPLQFHAFMLAPEYKWRDVREIADAVKHAEDLGYAAVKLPEHMIQPLNHGHDDDVYYDKSVLAAWLAAQTVRIRFFFYVMVVPYHPPIQAAKRLATLDQVTGGRLTIGTGVGWMKAEFEMLGIPFAERGAITDEYLRAMRVLWTEENPSFRGKYVNFAPASALPKPLQKPHIPLLIGGSGPAAQRRVVEFGQGWAPMNGSLAEVGSELTIIKEKLRAAGRDPAACTFPHKILIDYKRDRDVHAAFGNDVTSKRPAPEQYPLEAQAVIEGVEALRQAGFNCIEPRFTWRNPAELRQKMEWFATRVMPAFRAGNGQ